MTYSWINIYRANDCYFAGEVMHPSRKDAEGEILGGCDVTYVATVPVTTPLPIKETQPVKDLVAYAIGWRNAPDANAKKLADAVDAVVALCEGKRTKC